MADLNFTIEINYGGNFVWNPFALWNDLSEQKLDKL